MIRSLVTSASTSAFAPSLPPRIFPGDPLWHTGKFCGGDGPDQDISGLGARIGIYLQCISLSLATVTGLTRTLSALPAAIMTVFVLNIILTMKALQFVFEDNPMVQDFWVAQLQLFLLTTIVPFAMLFGKWKRFGWTKEALAGLCILYTYVQALWFWLAGYAQSDEVVCETADSALGSWKLFQDHARWAIVATYLFGLAFVLPLAILSYYRCRPGIFFPIWRMVPTRQLSLRAVALGVFTVPVYVLCIVLVEKTVRKGAQGQWIASTGQWFSLGIGISTLIEASWHTGGCILREIRGGDFSRDPEVLGFGIELPKVDAEDSSYMVLDNRPPPAPFRPIQANTI